MCKWCPFNSKQKYNLSQHIKNVHKGLEDPDELVELDTEPVETIPEPEKEDAIEYSEAQTI